MMPEAVLRRAIDAASGDYWISRILDECAELEFNPATSALHGRLRDGDGTISIDLGPLNCTFRSHNLRVALAWPDGQVTVFCKVVPAEVLEVRARHEQP